MATAKYHQQRRGLERLHSKSTEYQDFSRASMVSIKALTVLLSANSVGVLCVLEYSLSSCCSEGVWEVCVCVWGGGGGGGGIRVRVKGEGMRTFEVRCEASMCKRGREGKDGRNKERK